MSLKFKKMHTISYIDKNVVQYRQRLILGSYCIIVKNSFNLYKAQLIQYKAIITKILKNANKIIDQKNKGCFYKNNEFIRYRLKTSAFPYNNETGKSQGSRMGKGKGAVLDSFFPVKAGFSLFELINVESNIAMDCFLMLKAKMPVAILLKKIVY